MDTFLYYIRAVKEMVEKKSRFFFADVLPRLAGWTGSGGEGKIKPDSLPHSGDREGVRIMEILYQDRRVLVCLKPPGVLSTDEPGGMPELLRAALGEEHGCVRTVHRLDRAVGGVKIGRAHV